MSNLSKLWFCGPGHYFWTSDVRLADLELGYCSTREELEQAIRNMAHAGREELEMGGSAYRTLASLTALPIHKPRSNRTTSWRAPIQLSA